MYSTLISIIEGHNARGIRQANLRLAAMQRFDRIDRKRLKGALLLFLGFSAQAFSAGLSSHADLIVKDSGATPRDGVRVTYLGTNGYQFEFKGHGIARFTCTTALARSNVWSHATFCQVTKTISFGRWTADFNLGRLRIFRGCGVTANERIVAA